MYEYIDGNGNKYLIKNEDKITIEYIPIKPHLSSSGVYDGGDYKKEEISSQEWIKLSLILNESIRNKESHIKKRVKMSGMVIIQKKNVRNSYILRPNSQELLEIENLLKSVINK